MSQNIENPATCELADKVNPQQVLPLQTIILNQQKTQNENETTLLAKLANYEAAFKSNNERITQLENELKQKEVDLVSLKKRISELEEEVSEAQKFKAQHAKEAEEIELLKAKSEDTLTRAKGILFEKTKVIKNQELQIEALNQQITSLKDVVSITKDLLEIRNLEVKQLETKIQCMEDKIGAEKERHDLMHKKLEHMIRYNGDLKREYETQLCLFSALRERYNERELAKGVVEDLQANSNGVPATSNSTEVQSTSASSTQVNDSNATDQEKSEEKQNE